MINTQSQRLEALKSYQILDTDREDLYDSITSLASYICKTPAALINFIDEKRQWTKASTGMEITEIPKEYAFCNYTIENDFLLEIKDALEDERFAENPLVTENPHIRYYAGIPLITPQGDSVGALCVIDFEPNQLDDHQKAALKVLAREVISHLEVDKKNRELKKMLAEAQEFRDLFNNSADLHCITDDEGKILYINDTIFSLLGLTATEVRGRTIWELGSPGESERLLPEIKAGIASGKQDIRIETKIMNKGGHTRWFEWCIVMKDDKWLVSGRDISVRKEYEQQLRILNLAVEKSTVGVCIRNEKSEIEWFNPALENITGYKLEDLKGKVFGNILLGKQTDLSVIEQALRNVQEQKPYEVEVVAYKKDSTPVWLYISNDPIFNDSGQLERQIGIMIDITERKRAEAQLVKAREEAVKLSEAKENFLSVMSHEMRTPLNAVIGMARILKEEDPLERQQENLNILEFSANNLLTLINDVLDFTKIETGNLELEAVPVKLNNLVSKTIESLKFKTRDSEVSINYEIDSRLPESILGDSTRLYQIFMNLLGNAVKFTRQGEVKLSLLLENENENEVRIKFAVSDTGIGIAADKLKTIFDPYTQAEADTARKYGGTGLGLAITKKLISLHQSEIRVKSEPGKGTTFYFTITFPKSKGGAAKVFEEEKETALNAKVLVVDDNAMNRLLAKKILSKWTVETDFAENGLEAINKIKNADYDLVLMDVHMPVMGGFEASKTLRKMDGQLGRVPIIALTGTVINADDDDFQSSGMNDFILKPFEPSSLYRKIKPYLQ